MFYKKLNTRIRIGSTTREANIPIRQHDECLGMKALRFLMAGHSLEEPMLRYCLNMIQLKVIKRLEHCRIKLKESVCLVGVPDPMNQLAEGEVYAYSLNLLRAINGPSVTCSGVYHTSERHYKCRASA